MFLIDLLIDHAVFQLLKFSRCVYLYVSDADLGGRMSIAHDTTEAEVTNSSSKSQYVPDLHCSETHVSDIAAHDSIEAEGTNSSSDSEYVPDSHCSDSSLSPIIPLQKFAVDSSGVVSRKLSFAGHSMATHISDVAAESGGHVEAGGHDDSTDEVTAFTSGPTAVPTISVVNIESEKRYYCLYCDRAYARIKPHLVSQHAEELEVAKMMALNDQQAAAAHLQKLRNLGNHKHNCDVIREGVGCLVVVYRPQDGSTCAADYVPCPQCYGYYGKSQLWKHCLKRCPCSNTVEQCERRVVSRAKFLLPVPNNMKTQTWEILSHLREDAVKRAILNDTLILQYAQKLTIKHGSDPDRHEHVRCKVRELGRLLVQLKEHGIHSIADALDPERFKDLVYSVHQVCGFCHDTTTYSTPSLALKLGHTLKKCAVMLISEALQTSSKEVEEKSTAFIRLCDIEWADQISSKALKTLHDMRLNKQTILPLADDIAKMTHCLSEKAAEATKQLQLSQSDACSHTAWCTLTEVTLAQLILFNRRRVGEVSKMTIDDYKKASVGDVHSDMMEHLSELEKRLCNKLTRVQVVGKCGTHVPVLLTSNFNNALQIIVNKRAAHGVPDSNKFVFAKSGANKHLRGSDVIRKYADDCGAKWPETLRGTALRKHVATLSQVLNLKDNELDVLAQFMGHNIKVHRDYYRLPSEVLQTAKVAKLLMAIETGQQQRLTGQSLDDVYIDLNEGCCA